MSGLIQLPAVDREFGDTVVAAMALACRLPRCLDLTVLASGIRDAVRIYLAEAGEPDVNELHREIRRLHTLARRKDYAGLAKAIASLSPTAAALLNDRGRRPSFNIRLPDQEAFADPNLRGKACLTVEALCSTGAELARGRNRPSGRPSRRTLRHHIYAPKPSRHFARRKAERNFLMWLRIAWADASGMMPPKTADPRKPGPFGRLVRACLSKVGAGHVNVAELINNFDRPDSRKPTLQRQPLSSIKP